MISMMIPLLDLKKQYHFIKEEIDARLQEIFESGMFTQGLQLKHFEEEIAKLCQEL